MQRFVNLGEVVGADSVAEAREASRKSDPECEAFTGRYAVTRRVPPEMRGETLTDAPAAPYVARTLVGDPASIYPGNPANVSRRVGDFSPR